MNVLKINTSPTFQIVSRKKLTNLNLTIKLAKEATQIEQTINATATLLPNENYNLLLASFPNGVANDKFSFIVFDGSEIVCLGKLMIIAPTEVVKKYTKKTTPKYYK